MTARLRAIRRSCVLSVFLLGWVGLHLLGSLVLWTSSSRRRWRHFYLRGGARGACRVMGIEVEVHGSRPEPGSLLVTNHLGYVDVLALASTLDAVFVSRADVRHWPLLGPLVSLAGTIYLDRDRRRAIPGTVQRMRRELDRGSLVVFFPEGTSSDGRSLLPFKPSLFQGATQMRVRVHAAALGYRVAPDDPPAETSVAWWDEHAGFGGHFWRLLGLRRIRALLVFSPRVLDSNEGDRKSLSQRAEEAVGEALRERWELESEEGAR